MDKLWLKDESLEDSANLPEPGVLALEITEDLEAALEQFATVAEDLKRSALWSETVRQCISPQRVIPACVSLTAA